MFNSHGKKPLYEAIHEAQAKSASDKSLQPLHPQAVQHIPAPAPAAEHAAEPLRTVTRWPTKPSLCQFHAGRIELSLPYQLVIAIVLSAVVLLLAIFRLGQHWPIQKSPQSVSKKPLATPKAAAPKQVVIVESRSASQQPGEATAAKKGANRIVIQTHQNSTDLEPVKNFFAASGIETEIRKIGSWYYLVTAEKYDNPEKAGTDGFAAKQRIIELGAKYQPPAGYNSFGTKPFSDSYGMRLE